MRNEERGRGRARRTGARAPCPVVRTHGAEGVLVGAPLGGGGGGGVLLLVAGAAGAAGDAGQRRAEPSEHQGRDAFTPNRPAGNNSGHVSPTAS